MDLLGLCLFKKFVPGLQTPLALFGQNASLPFRVSCFSWYLVTSSLFPLGKHSLRGQTDLVLHLNSAVRSGGPWLSISVSRPLSSVWILRKIGFSLQINLARIGGFDRATPTGDKAHTPTFSRYLLGFGLRSLRVHLCKGFSFFSRSCILHYWFCFQDYASSLKNELGTFPNFFIYTLWENLYNFLIISFL